MVVNDGFGILTGDPLLDAVAANALVAAGGDPATAGPGRAMTADELAQHLAIVKAATQGAPAATAATPTASAAGPAAARRSGGISTTLLLLVGAGLLALVMLRKR